MIDNLQECPRRVNVESRRELLFGPIVSLVLGVLSVALLLRMVAGIPAIVIGYLCLRRINERDDGSPVVVAGRRLAIGGMVFGAAGSVLGVIGIISVILTRAGEASRRMTCANQLRQIGQAVNIYHNTMGEVYPSATVEGPWGLAGFASWMGEPYVDRLGWMVNILPFLDVPLSPTPLGERGQGEGGMSDQQGPYFKLRASFETREGWRGPGNEQGANRTMRGFLCPSHPFYEPGVKPAVSHYVGITGVGEDAVELSATSPDVGFFGYERRLRSGRELPDPIPKGQSYTLLAAETMLENGPWVAADRSTLRGVDPSTRPYVGYRRPFGGMHPGGVNLLMVDGAVEFYSERGNPVILENRARLTLEE
jgi:prepilin-type processing-associated H-X9-DG protein